MTPLRMGIMGCSRQAVLAVVRASRSCPDVAVTSVASRSPDRARQFAAEHGIPVVMNSYRALVEDDSLDAVYIGLPNNCHAYWSVAAMRAGRHVLAEKPLCLSQAEAQVIAETAQRTGRACWEAIPTATHPWQAELRRIAESGQYGAVVSMAVDLSFDIGAERVSKLRPRRDGGGVFLDTAPYWLQIVESVCGLDVRASALELTEDPAGFDVAAVAQVLLSNGVTARLRASYLNSYTASACVRFEAATFRLLDLLRANLGNCKLRGEWTDPKSGEIQRASFGPLHAFEIQLCRFASLTRAPAPWRSTASSESRRKVMDQLLLTAHPVGGKCDETQDERETG